MKKTRAVQPWLRGELSGGQRFDWAMEDAYQFVRRKDNITTLASLVFHQIWKFYCKSYFGGTPLHDNNLLSNESIINEYIQHISVMKLNINNSISPLHFKTFLSPPHELYCPWALRTLIIKLMRILIIDLVN
ncbi:hypothetical protein PPL_12595 [Heterostelium album PN500]|uniref:Uncharacterized protein n=1 Tax=Heterostelium pallidum (strain ATCC 26659 / Pp 5 / PN500) TaxID=670386 RepID=D3BN19_HETP5|nr:hypothetical protein PPL_12595 [Heterostelium album PN500]EFA77381.1 hypothetical protein PPL_12595 [Heterostelium album PN500]|eukprot:XP_020429510.1 hypothetical protein PPL_12595 [Heterostelium album PN500]